MSTDTGLQAEDVASEYLKRQGYRVIQRNWKTRWCEVDIISRKNGVIYFVEVKYRRTVRHGGGLEYITPSKLARMAKAAESWMAQSGQGEDYALLAAAVEGDLQRPRISLITDIAVD